LQDEEVEVLPVDFEEAVTMDEDELSEDEDEDEDEEHDEVSFTLLTFVHISVPGVDRCSV
jgi:hypothetical protein